MISSHRWLDQHSQQVFLDHCEDLLRLANGTARRDYVQQPAQRRAGVGIKPARRLMKTSRGNSSWAIVASLPGSDIGALGSLLYLHKRTLTAPTGMSALGQSATSACCGIPFDLSYNCI